MKLTTLMRAGAIVHPGYRNVSGYCLNPYKTDSGEMGVVFASEVTRNSKNNGGYLKAYNYDFVCKGSGIFITKLESEYYMVGINTPSCVTLMLCSRHGIGSPACIYRATDPRNIGTLNLDNSSTDVIEMERWENYVYKLPLEVAEEIKESVRDSLGNDILSCLSQDKPVFANEDMWNTKYDICKSVMQQVS